MRKYTIVLVVLSILSISYSSAINAQEAAVNPGDSLLNERTIGGDDVSSSYEAALALGAIGEPALSYLRELLNSDNPQIQYLAAVGLGQAYPLSKDDYPQVIELLMNDNGSLSYQLSWTVAQFKEDALPELTAMLKQDGQKPIRAAMALADMGELAVTAIPALADNLSHVDPQARQAAAECLARLGPLAAEAVPQLLARIDDPDEDTVGRVAYALAEIKAQPDLVLPVLLGQLRQPDGRTGDWIISALAAYGELAADAVPEIARRIAQVDRPSDAGVYVEALSRIGAPATPAFIELSRHTDPDMRTWGLIGLGRIGECSTEACTTLLAALSDPVADVRAFAAQSLGEINADPTLAVPSLAATLHDPDPEVRRCGARALSFFGAAAFGAMEELLSAYDAGPQEVKSWAAEALGRIGPRAAPAIPRLAADLSVTGDGYVAAALVRMGASVDELEPALLTAMRDDYQAYTIANALVEVGAPATGILAALVSDGDTVARLYAAYALGQLGAGASAAIPALKKAGQNGDIKTRLLALEALAAISGDTSGLAGAIAEGLAAPELDTKSLACMIIANTKLQSPELVASLRQALTDQDYYVRLAAINALTQLGAASAPAIPELLAILKELDLPY